MQTVTTLTKASMSVDEYLVWAESQPGRYELVDGIVYAMTPAPVIHAEIKAAIYMALTAGVRARRLPCHVMPDGMTVRIEESKAYEPGALIYCGARLARHALEVPNPVIVFEVLSPSSRHIDASQKLAGYFRVPSVAHYLIVDSDQPLIIHHARRDDNSILTRIVREGMITLDPPGLELALADVYTQP
jgi:Uma2 family endonuclease